LEASKGCGFVKYKTHEEAQKAIEELNQKKEIGGKFIFVQKHIYKVQNQMGKQMPLITQQMKKAYESNLYVQFIPKEISEEQLKEEMSKAGKVISVKLKDFVQTNRGTGETFVNFKSGYVCYEDVIQAQKCIQMFH
jgi:polyadenylate-binding protein